MRTNSPNRQPSIVTAIAVLFLAFSVLGWGTGYKLSLYDPPGSQSKAIPAAKLLSQKERPSTTQVVESLFSESSNHKPSGYFPAIIIVALMLGLQLVVSASMLEVGLDDSRRQRSADMSFFSFRPPPAFLPSN